MIEIIGFVVLGLFSGLAASSLGIGGGVVFVPSLVVFFGFSQHVAQGTSLAIIVPTAVVGTLVHAQRGRVEWRTVAWASTGGVVGGLLGSAVALSLDALVLRRLFAALLVVIAARMLSNLRRHQ